MHHGDFMARLQNNLSSLALAIVGDNTSITSLTNVKESDFVGLVDMYRNDVSMGYTVRLRKGHKLHCCRVFKSGEIDCSVGYNVGRCRTSFSVGKMFYYMLEARYKSEQASDSIQN